MSLIGVRLCVTLARMRNTDTSAAVAANKLRKHKRWAEELQADGWLVQQWPMEPQHYGDYCKNCDRSPEVNRPITQLICKPFALTRPDRGGLCWHYTCPLGHSWICWFSPDKGYFSDCMCGWCVTGRAEDGAKTWPRTPFYNETQQ